jgi:glycosyltransferase involved in cell wall biosynthesis
MYICLNMIVKNESKIITRMLDTVCHLIDSYLICDTGSTDNTIDVIERYMADKNIPGIVVSEPFRDFGYNRSFALAQCAGREKADYILLLDADMMFRAKNDIRSMLSRYTVWYAFQGSESFHYKNIRFVKNNCGIRYWGVTHEYVDIPDGRYYNSGTFEPDNVFIRDLGDGGCKADKYERDVRLLTDGLREEPDNPRYTFYLANSYRDSGNREKAIETYTRRTKLGGWAEEIWVSHYEIGKLSPPEIAIYHWLEAYDAFPERIENLYEIVKYYRIRGKHELAYTFYQLACAKMRKTPDFLFANNDVYDHLLEYEFSIIGYYKNPENVAMSAHCMELLDNPRISGEIFNNLMSNYKFYAPVIEGKSDAINDKMTDGRFVGSTPSICYHGGELTLCRRFVNYHINENGNYTIRNNDGQTIETVNILTPNHHIVEYDRQYDENNRYKGIEDIRLFSHRDKLLFIANRPFNDKIEIEFGEIVGNIVQSKFLKYEHQQTIEKNWVLFEDVDAELKCVYSWYPLIIGDIDCDGLYTKTHTVQTPASFRNLRGSTNGVCVGDEIWFICHSVSDEDRRYYYHMMVAIDCETFQVRRHSPFLTFEKTSVEYSLGFVVQDDNLLIGYSVMDRETKIITVAKQWFEEQFIVVRYAQ